MPTYTGQASTKVGSCIAHRPLEHLNIMGLFDGDPACRFCRMETETVYRIICC